MLNGNIKEIVGTVVEVSSAQLGTDKNMSKRYPFVMIETDDGELIRIKSLLVDAHVDQMVRPGQHAAFYVRPARIMLGKANFLLATESNHGIAIQEFPFFVLLFRLGWAIVGGMILSAFFGFFAVGPFIYEFFSRNFTLTALICAIPLYFMVWNALKMIFIAGETSMLRQRLLGGTSSARPMKVAVKEM